MDGHRFDSLTKRVAGTSRRSLLKAALGTAIGGATTVVGRRGTDAASRLRPDGETCRAASDCSAGYCVVQKDGRRRCGIPDYCANTTCSQTEVCLDGRCFERSGPCWLYGVVAGEGYPTICICELSSGATCERTFDCPIGEACFRQGGGDSPVVGVCYAGCRF
jgi:hypothetical protein